MMVQVLRTWLGLLWILCAAFMPCSKGYAQSYLQLYSETTQVSLAPKFDYFWEGNERQTLRQIQRQAGLFQRYQDGNPNFGFSQQGLWLRVNLDNMSVTEKWVVDINFSQIDYVDFYLLNGDELVSSSFQGKLQGDQEFRIPTFDVNLPIGEPLTLYIRVQSESSSLIVPATLKTLSSHSLSMQIDGIAWGLFYGGLLILAIYNFVLFLNVREFSLLAYITYIITVVFWQFVWGGHVQLIFPLGQPSWFAAHTELIFILIGLSSGMFTLAFLDARRYAPLFSKVLLSFIIVQALLAIIAVLGVLPPTLKNNLIYGVGILAIIAYISAGIEAFLNKFRPASYFIFAWSLLAFGAVVGILSLFGVLPSNTFTSYVFQVAVFLEAGLFSVALMEKSRSQLQGEVEQATIDLRNNMVLIEEQNARLDIARKDAIKASNIKSQFLANMSHEIRTPLNAILGFSRELEQAGLALAQQEQVKIINSAADNLLTIVNDVLDFSKIEAGKLQINNAPFSPLEVFEEMVAIMAKTAQSKNLDFIFQASPLPEKLISDDIRLKQVLTNLIGNALKFTSEGNVSLRVWANRRQHGVIELCFQVIDTGIGISRSDRKKLFSAFSQVDDALNRNYQGTGLGLVISQELVRLMNGTIDLKSQPGIGSTFTVMVRAQQIGPRTTFTYPQRISGVRVVVFDPCPMDRQASTAMLKDIGVDVIAIDSLDYLKESDFNPDFLMVFLPNHSRYNSHDILEVAMTVKADNRVVWYSKGDPLLNNEIYRHHFATSIGMPATPGRLLQILTHKHVPAPQRKQQAKELLTLPAINLLAVDDIPMNLMLIDTWFQNTPVVLTKANSGEQAVKLCRDTAYDIILMDVQMPGIDGLQASREIRKTELNLGTPIIAVTAHAFKEEQDRLLSSGMDDYLPKPIAYEALMSIIERWCDTAKTPTTEKSPSVSWQLAMQRANNNAAVSHHMMKEFVLLLPDTQVTIENAALGGDMVKLQQEVHRLHGASCYTGAPAIQSLASAIEVALKKDKHDKALALLPELYCAIDQFTEQSQPLLEQHAPKENTD